MHHFASMNIGEGFADVFEDVPRGSLTEFDKMLLDQALDTALAQLHLVFRS
jgi:hypothetical protein